MPKLLILSREADEYKQRLARAGLPDLATTTDFSTCDIVLGEPRLIREHLAELPNVKWIQSMYAGVEALMDPALRRDYLLTNARGVFGELMSEYVLGYLLAHEKGLFQRFAAQQAGQWDRFEAGWLRGKTLGLLGVGSIGAHIAGVAKAFRMNVWGYTRASEASAEVDRYFHGNELLQFAAGLDYLIVILPRTKETDQIVNAELLDALPAHAVLVNVGRGNAVDESALVAALENDKIAGAVLDVTAEEPLPEGHPFWMTKNLLLTFHTSAISYPDDITRLFIENYQLYIQGKPLKYQVDFERGY